VTTKPLALAAGVLALAGCSDPAAPRDLLLVTVDTLRADHLGPYGYERDTSPFLQQLASGSFVFGDAVSQSGTTPQSLASLMTGLYPYTDAIVRRNDPVVTLRSGTPTLAGALGERGFQTHAITSSVQAARVTGLDAGFESFDAVDVEMEPGAQRRPSRSAGEVTRLALEWLTGQRDPERPFFLWLHYLDPHHPYRAPDAYAELFAEHLPAEEGATRVYRHERIPRRRVSDGELARLVIAYDREIRYVDDALRELFEGAGDVLDAAAVVITADHGEALGDHRLIGHNELWEPILRVPLLLRLPGEPGGQIDLPVMLVDLVPTLLEIFGVPTAGRPLRGRSLLPLLRGEGGTGERLRLAEYQNRMAIYRGPAKLIARGTTKELYDVGADPRETRDLAEERTALRRRLVADAARLRETGPLLVLPAGDDPPPPSPQVVEELRALGYVE
jgi:arylsulfatase